MRLATVRAAGERGSALLVAMITLAFVVPLILSLAVLTMSETTLASSFSRSQEMRYAADSAAEDARLAACGVDLAALAAPGTEPIVTLDTGASLDLRREGVARQRESDTLYGTFPASSNSPQWRLLHHGPLTDTLPVMLPGPVPYVAVWVADDPEDADGNPLRDANGRLRLIAAAYANRGDIRLVQRAVACMPPPGQRAARLLFGGDWP